MSDEEGSGKKSGYRLEYAGSARAKCKGPKPCSGTPIAKGELRMGSLVDFRGNTSFAWRHWGCVTDKIIANMKKSFEEADELDGFEDLNDADQEKVRKAWEVGHVADADIPETARKPEKGGDDEADDDDDDEKPKKKKAAAKSSKKAADDTPGAFKLEYASSSRSKCKGGCDESIGKNYFRMGHEVDFRGNKTLQFQHWGCVPDSMFAKLKTAYAEPSKIVGYDDLQDADKEKVERAWEEGQIPEDDKGPGEPADVPKKAPAKRAKKANGEPPKKRARKAKKEEDDDEDDEEEEDKPKPKRAPAKKAPAKKAPAKKKSQKDNDESGEDFGDEIDAIVDDEEGEDEDSSSKKPKRAPASKPNSKSSKPTSKKAVPKSSSSRKRKVIDYAEDEDDE